MIFYISWFLIVLLLLVFKKKDSNINIKIIFILFILVYGCRDYGGVDDLNYIEAFNNAIQGKVVYGIEDSFLAMARFLGGLGFNYKALFFLYALVSFVFVYLAYKELCSSNEDWIIVILGFFVFSFFPTITIMRQFVAASIITYACTLKLKNKKILPLILIALATIFHQGAVIGFVVYFMSFIKIKPWIKIIIPIGCLYIGYTGYLYQILNKMIVIIPTKYLGYIDPYFKTVPHIGLLHTLLLAIYLCQFILLINNNIDEELDEKIHFLESQQMVYFCVFFITLSNGWISRLSIYFILFLPFIFKTFIARFSVEKDKKILFTICLFAYLLLFVYQITGSPDSLDIMNLIPYKGSFDFIS